MNRLDTALALATAHLPVLPLLGPDEGDDNQKGKQPRQSGWQRKRNTPEDIAGWFQRFPNSNLGLVTGAASGLICIDVDPRNGGDAWLKEHTARLKADGAALERTGSGGFHLWFVHPGGYIASKRGKHGIAAGVELLADGGHQAVIAPSVHRNGSLYVWKADVPLADLRDFGAPLPAWIAVPSAEAAPTKRQRAKAEAYTDLSGDVERCRAKLAAMDPAIEGAGGDHATFVAACQGREHALSPEAFWPLLLDWNETCLPPWDAEALMVKMQNAYAYSKAAAPGQASPHAAFEHVEVAAPTPPQLSPEAAAAQAEEMTSWQDRIVTNRDGNWKSHVFNVALLLTNDERLRECFKFNEFTGAVEVVEAPWRQWSGTPTGEWTDDDRVALAEWIVGEYGHNAAMNETTVHNALRNYTRRFTYHPVRDYLNGLRWDGKPRLATWLSRYLGAEVGDYHAAIGLHFLVGAVARVMQPGYKLDTMLVLEGEQGIGKSRAVRILFGDWYTDAAIDFSSKDAAQTIRGMWGVELAEMHTVGRAEASLFKSFLSRQADRQRDAYDRCTVTHPRQCVFIGTTNQEFYQTDDTGGRRLWPVACGRIDLRALGEDRNQLWAEATALFNGGEKGFLEKAAEALAKVEQDRRHLPDPWIEAIRGWLVNQSAFVVSGQTRVTSSEVFGGALGSNVRDVRPAEAQRLGRCMRKLGFKAQAFKRRGEVMWGYVSITDITSDL